MSDDELATASQGIEEAMNMITANEYENENESMSDIIDVVDLPILALTARLVKTAPQSAAIVLTARYVITYPENAAMDVNGACTAGSYGHKCKDSCSGNCLNGETCHFTTGECSCGCAPGYDYTRDDHCQTACDDYSYGQNCSSRCGHCLVDAVCDRISGNCPSGGCKMGYSGSRCDQLCTDNTFGYNCEGLCHCNNISEQCNVTNGDCSSGCAIGWAGNNCSKDNNIIKPGHTDVTASISNTYSTCDAFRSIDGKILLNSSSDDIALCQRCSVAEGSRSWLQLDLAVITAVSYIRVYGRNTGN
ncbi:multiple epidermal growth factor-like domains protein 10 [Mya arenaria]|uniref:multiple epidermal growth factor-like domains protein 10 n=1 Tax=Mya arenaria TaxID=6604 RepID=UPI0022E4BE85|nr:multiple epidermal growth factor-like domains protein 10 [Mya arenaria]